jgi:hypothetical protein
MTLVPVVLNLLLAVLLLAALAVGWRLDRRLKDLRQSHLSFAKAVQDLDQAALRAQAGLDQLRAAADEAGDLLGDRLIRARELSEKLDSLIASADRAARAVTLAKDTAPEAPRARLAPEPDSRPDPRLDPRPDPRPDQRANARTAAPAKAPPIPRGRSAMPSLDDDLFDDPQEDEAEKPFLTPLRPSPFGGRR